MKIGRDKYDLPRNNGSDEMSTSTLTIRRKIAVLSNLVIYALR